jgi:hypothetical protein
MTSMGISARWGGVRRPRNLASGGWRPSQVFFARLGIAPAVARARPPCKEVPHGQP